MAGGGKKVVLKPQPGRLRSSIGKVSLQARSQLADDAEEPLRRARLRAAVATDPLSAGKTDGEARRCPVRRSAVAVAAAAAAADTKSALAAATFVPASDNSADGHLGGGSSSSRAVVLHPGPARTGVQLRPNHGRIDTEVPAVGEDASPSRAPQTKDGLKSMTSRASVTMKRRTSSPLSLTSANSRATAPTPASTRRVLLAPARLKAKATMVAGTVAKTSAAPTESKALATLAKSDVAATAAKSILVPGAGATLAEKVREQSAALEKRTLLLRAHKQAADEDIVTSLRAHKQAADEELPAPKRKRRRMVAKDGASAVSQQGAGRSGAKASAQAPLSEKLAPSHATRGASAHTSVAAVELLNEADRAKLREAVHSHLRQICSDDEDAQVVADWVVVMVEDRKSRTEMVAELTFFKEGASEFVEWVHERIHRLVEVRQSLSRKASAPPVLRHSAKERQKSDADEDVEIIDEADPSSAIDLTSDRPSAAPANADSLPGTDTAKHRKLEMIAEMTKQLKVILAKLSDTSARAPSEKDREKYQTLANSLQAQIQSLSPPSQPKKNS